MSLATQELPAIVVFNGWRVPPGFKSDGCTWAPDEWFGTDLKPACILHDFLRRYALVTVQDADRIFHRYLIALGAPRWLARFYWFVVKITRWRFKHTEKLPYDWSEYRTPVADIR